jgi:hypothetical protein
MKRIVYLIFIIALLVFSCVKMSDILPVSKMKNLEVSNDFNWSTTRMISIDLHTIPNGVIRVSSEDESILYSKRIGNGMDHELQFPVDIPADITSLRINDHSVDISSSSVDFTFPHSYKSSSSINYSLNFNGNLLGESSICCKYYIY